MKRFALFAVATAITASTATAQDALLNEKERADLEAMLVFACKGSSLPTFECARMGIALLDKITAKVAPSPAPPKPVSPPE